MNRMNHTDGLETFVEDYKYADSGILSQFKDAFKSLLLPTSTGGVIRGFTLRVSLADSTKLEIWHNNSYSVGQAVNKDFEYIQTSTSTDLIPLADYTNGVVNVVGINYKDTLTSNKINIVTGVSTATRILRDWQYGVYTLANWAAKLSTGWVEIGRVTANGTAPTSLNLTNVPYVSSLINNEAILNSTFRIFQTIISQSQTYNDAYAGTPNNLESDLNQIRTIIREMKGTLAYTDLIQGNMLDYDRSVTGLHGEGVIAGYTNELNLQTSTGLTAKVLDGKALIDKKIVFKQTSTGIDFGACSSNVVGNWTAKTGYEAITFAAEPDTQSLVHNNVFVGSVQITDTFNNDITSLIGTEITIDYVNGTVTNTAGGTITTGSVIYCYYSYNTDRIDIVQMNNAGVVSIKQGTAGDSLLVSIFEPTADIDNIKLFAVLISKAITQLTSANIYDRRSYAGYKTSASKSDREITLTSTGASYLKHRQGKKDITIITMPTVDSTYLGEPSYIPVSNNVMKVYLEGGTNETIDTLTVFDDREYELFNDMVMNDIITMQTEDFNYNVMIDVNDGQSSIDINDEQLIIRNAENKVFNLVLIKKANINGTLLTSTGGVVINHNLNTLNHFTFALPKYASGAELMVGNLYVVKGLNSDIIYNTGNSGLSVYYTIFKI